MKNISKIILSFLIGVGIGALIEATLTVFFGTYVVGTPDFIKLHSPAFVKITQTLIYGGFGIVSVIASQIYKVKTISPFFKTTFHLIILFIYYIFAGFYLKWFKNLYELTFSLISFFVIYILIWTVFYFINKRDVEIINKKLN